MLQKQLAKRNENGAALLTVLIAMMIIMLMLFEFQYSSMVERKLAYNELNQLQAYYLAKSGVRIGLLRVALYGRIRKSKDIASLSKTLGQDVKPYLEAIWNLPLPPFPPSKSDVKKLDQNDKSTSEKILQETRVTEGTSSHVITSEGAKINLNFLQLPKDSKIERINFSGPPQGPFSYPAMMLINLLENFLRDSENPNEEFDDLRPEELVLDIMDWINPGATRFAGGSKDTYYETLKPPYKAKRNRFYTVDEVKLVKGMSDHLFEKLKPYITVYSYDGKINLNTASTDVYRALWKDFTDDDVKKIMEKRGELNGWPSETAFVDFVTKTLGRSGFTTVYNDSKNYPFGTGSQSFIIEGMGTIQKSKSSVQRLIRVAVALTNPPGGGIARGLTNQADCKAAGNFWHPTNNVCIILPITNNEQCVFASGSWRQNPTRNNQYCCYLNNIPNPLCQDPAPGTTPGATTGTPAVEPGALKILYWSET